MSDILKEFSYLDNPTSFSQIDTLQVFKDAASKLVALGEELFKQGDINGAVKAFNKAIEISPDFAIAYNNLGFIFWETGLVEIAFKYFSRAIKLDPFDIDIVMNYGKMMTSLGHFDLARDSYKDFLIQYPDDKRIGKLLVELEEKKVTQKTDPTDHGQKDENAELKSDAGQSNNLSNISFNVDTEKRIKIEFMQATNEIDVQWFKPLAFGYLKAYLDKNLKLPVIMNLSQSIKNLEKFDIVAISSTSQNYSQAIKIACEAKLKNEDAVTVLGGHHITYLPDTLRKDFDIGVMGEGEQTFLELVEYFQDNGLNLRPDKLKGIQGIVFWKDGSLIKTGKRGLIRFLDRLPHPDRQSDEAQYIFSSRGCPFKCSFCSSSAFWDETRFFSAQYVLEEIEQVLAQFPEMKQVPIWDDLFIANKSRLRKIIELVEVKGINRKVSFSFSVRANLVDDEMCHALKKLNVIGVAFGAESGSDRILKLMNKGTTVKQNQKAIDLLNKHNIPLMCSFIVGWPTETEDEVKKTFEFILKNIVEGKLHVSNAINILMPIPGTELWNSALKDGLFDLRNFDWDRLAVFASYKDSKLKTFDEWVECRRKNNSIYLAEETLPQERLY